MSDGIVPPNSEFDLPSLLSQCFLEEYLHYSDELFSLSPLTSPEPSPPGSPAISTSRLPSPISEITTAQKPPGTGKVERMKRKSRINRALQREKTLREGSQHSVRPATIARHIQPSLPLETGVDIPGMPATKGAYKGLAGETSAQCYTLEELVGKNSAYGFQLIQARETATPLIDREGRVFGVLAGHPRDPGWQQVHEAAAEAMADVGRSLPPLRVDEKHRRGHFLALNAGVSYGGGQTQPGNLCPKTAALRRASSTLLSNAAFRRIAGFGSSVFATWAPEMHKIYAKMKRTLQASNPDLHFNFKNSVFAAAAFNFGPQTVCHKHKDFANLPFGMCAITALGSFDYTCGGHLVLWDCHLVVEFPPGFTILIPSALISHSNTPLREGETRYSFTQYSAGGLFRWVDHGLQPDGVYYAALSKKELLQDEEKKRARRDLAVSTFSFLTTLKHTHVYNLDLD